jgi:hypothetical protein
MYTGKLVFVQLMGHLPLHPFRRCVARYNGNRKVQRFGWIKGIKWTLPLFAHYHNPSATGTKSLTLI